MDPEDDPVGRLRAEMDQTREGVKGFAQTLWVFHSELGDQGFDEEQALMLSITFLTESLRNRGGDE